MICFARRARLPSFGYSWRVGWRRWLGNGQGSPAVWILDLGMSSCEMLELKLLGCRRKKTSARLWKDIFADDVVFLTFIFFAGWCLHHDTESSAKLPRQNASSLRHDVSGLGLSSSGPTHRQGHPGPELHMIDSWWFVWTFRWPQVSIGPTMPRQAVHYPSWPQHIRLSVTYCDLAIATCCNYRCDNRLRWAETVWLWWCLRWRGATTL